jgi:hypothetical protein
VVNISRRRFIQAGMAAATVAALGELAWSPIRVGAATKPLPDIQFDIGNFITPAQAIDGVMFRFAPVYTCAATYRLAHQPTPTQQGQLRRTLSSIESKYPFSPAGVFLTVGYGLPYFARFREVASRHMPRLRGNNSRWALEEAVASPTDVHHSNPAIKKQTFNVALRIESNDLVIVLRSDSMDVITDCLQELGDLSWLHSTSTRMIFTQPGLPRKLADERGLAFASSINPDSPMWMGFADQQVSGAGPAPIVTFVGNSSARLTTARPGDYFDNGSILHLAHDIEDLAQFYKDPDEPYTERCQYMFRSNPMPAAGEADQYTDGGGPAFLENVYQGPNDALHNAKGVATLNGEHRMGHLCALQRSSRAPDGTPMHIRADGPGFDSMDVPDGSEQPKLQFLAYVPTADFFARMRKNQASLDLVAENKVEPDDNGLERFITATRRQNFLIPPRRHRALPLVEVGR